MMFWHRSPRGGYVAVQVKPMNLSFSTKQVHPELRLSTPTMKRIGFLLLLANGMVIRMT